MAKNSVKVSTLSVDDMDARAKALEKEIYLLRNDFALQRRHEKPHLLKTKRHERAKMLTLITQNRRSAP